MRVAYQAGVIRALYEAGLTISADSLERERRALVADLAALSSKGRVIYAKHAGHNIHLEDPELVVSAVRNDPVPESLRFVTRRTAGALPHAYAARVDVPKPCAPGTIGRVAVCAATRGSVHAAAAIRPANTHRRFLRVVFTAFTP